MPAPLNLSGLIAGVLAQKSESGFSRVYYPTIFDPRDAILYFRPLAKHSHSDALTIAEDALEYLTSEDITPDIDSNLPGWQMIAS